MTTPEAENFGFCRTGFPKDGWNPKKDRLELVFKGYTFDIATCFITRTSFDGATQSDHMYLQRRLMEEAYGSRFMDVIALWNIFVFSARLTQWRGEFLLKQLKTIALQQLAMIWLEKSLSVPDGDIEPSLFWT